MKIIYTHPNLLLVENAKNLLDDAGVKTELRNQYAAGAIGDIAPINAWPELWLKRDDQEVWAKDVLSVLTSTEQNESEWLCPSCAQQNNLPFLQCWACNAELEE